MLSADYYAIFAEVFGSKEKHNANFCNCAPNTTYKTHSIYSKYLFVNICASRAICFIYNAVKSMSWTSDVVFFLLLRPEWLLLYRVSSGKRFLSSSVPYFIMELLDMFLDHVMTVHLPYFLFLMYSTWLNIVF